MRILISTTNRHVPIDQPTGYMFVYDLEKNEVLRKCTIIEPPYLKENPNPRGGLRGLKGISIRGDRIAFVNSSTIFIYDSNWNPIKTIWHPSCASMHELILGENVLWVTSTDNDLLLCFDYDGNLLKYFDARKFRTLIEATSWKPKPFLTDETIFGGKFDFRDPRTHDLVNTDNAHLNSVTFMPNGDLLISCGLLKNSDFSRLLGIKLWLLKKGIWQRLLRINQALRKTVFRKKKENSGELVFQPAHGTSAVVKISKEGEIKTCLSFYGASVPSHSARILQDGSAIYLNSSKGEIIHFDLDSGKIISKTSIGDRFLRGARQLPDGTLLLGDNNYFIRFDIDKCEIISKIKITDETFVAVFDFCVLPDHYGLPPQSFLEHHNLLMPVHQT